MRTLYGTLCPEPDERVRYEEITCKVHLTLWLLAHSRSGMIDTVDIR